MSEQEFLAHIERFWWHFFKAGTDAPSEHPTIPDEHRARVLDTNIFGAQHCYPSDTAGPLGSVT